MPLLQVFAYIGQQSCAQWGRLRWALWVSALSVLRSDQGLAEVGGPNSGEFGEHFGHMLG
jgi:hypothetical protein